MKTKLVIILLLVATASALSAGPRVFFGVGVGYPNYGYAAYPYGGYYPPAAPVSAYVAYPRPGYAWVGGYWHPYGARYAWRPGAWVRPPFAGAAWVGPRYYGGRYVRGYWRR